jgi:hypothetical protein
MVGWGDGVGKGNLNGVLHDQGRMSNPKSKRKPIGVVTDVRAFSIGTLYSTNGHLGVGGGGACAIRKATRVALVDVVVDAG